MPNAFLDAIRLVHEAAARHGFRIALIGGFALPFHGVRRATGDVAFLIDARGADALNEALSAAGYETLHRSHDAANYRGAGTPLIGVDVVYARRAPTLAMLDRAAVPKEGGGVPVVDVEGLIGLKLQAVVNNPARRRQDEADIVALLALHLPSINRALLDEYFTPFDQRDALTRFLDEARQRRG